jgi:hypothetical protein
LPWSFIFSFFLLFLTFFKIHLFVLSAFLWKIDCFVFVVSVLNQHLFHRRSFFVCILSTSSYRAEIVKQNVFEREKSSNSHSYCPWKKNCFSAEQIHSSLSPSLLYPFYCCCCLCIKSLSLSIVYNGIIQKKVKKTKITIHHRTKKKSGGFLTNNNDRHVTNINSFPFSLFLFVFYYIRILNREGIRLYCLLKCIDKYIQKMHEMVIACGIVQ